MSVFFFVTGNSLLHSPMVVEKLGSRKNPGSHDGSRPRHHIRGRETLQKEVVIGLPLRKPKKPQLLGLQILFLWITVIGQCHWWVHLLFLKVQIICCPSGFLAKCCMTVHRKLHCSAKWEHGWANSVPQKTLPCAVCSVSLLRMVRFSVEQTLLLRCTVLKYVLSEICSVILTRVKVMRATKVLQQPPLYLTEHSSSLVALYTGPPRLLRPGLQGPGLA